MGETIERGAAAVAVIAAAVAVAGILWAGGDGNGQVSASSPTTAPRADPVIAAVPPPSGSGTAGDTSSGPPADAAESEAVLEDGRHPVLLTDVDVAGSTVELDLVRWLSGAEADRVWAESNPDDPHAPNDHLTVNDDARLRTLPVTSDVQVMVAYLDSSSDNPVPIAFGDLPAYLGRYNMGANNYGPSMFWLTVHDGRVVTIQEQWTP